MRGYGILKNTSIIFLILYSISFLYTRNNWTKLEKEFEDISMFEVAIILFYRAVINIIVGIVAVPLAILSQLMVGIREGGFIIMNELSEILQILRRIFDTWFVRWIWNSIVAIMNAIGEFLRPYFTYLVRISIYLGIMGVMVGIVLSLVKMVSLMM